MNVAQSIIAVVVVIVLLVMLLYPPFHVTQSNARALHEFNFIFNASSGAHTVNTFLLLVEVLTVSIAGSFLMFAFKDKHKVN